jgi:hypothetical protein
MKRILLLCSAFVLLTVNASAQKQKTWTEWSEKDAIKVMTDSAWAQTQKEATETDVPTGPGNSAAATRSASSREEKNAQSGETLGRKNMPLTLNYSIAFLTAKPVRQAFVRYLEIKSPETPADQAAQRRAFIDRDFGDLIVVTLKLEGTDQSKLTPALKLLSGDPKVFKDTAYLERKDGKRVALVDYRAPDQMGAKLIFPRTVEGKPFLDATSGEVRVYVELGKTKLSRRFKVAEMMYEGALEY